MEEKKLWVIGSKGYIAAVFWGSREDAMEQARNLWYSRIQPEIEMFNVSEIDPERSFSFQSKYPHGLIMVEMMQAGVK